VLKSTLRWLIYQAAIVNNKIIFPPFLSEGSPGANAEGAAALRVLSAAVPPPAVAAERERLAAVGAPGQGFWAPLPAGYGRAAPAEAPLPRRGAESGRAVAALPPPT